MCSCACLFCRDRWLIEYRAMWVSVCVNESVVGGVVLCKPWSCQNRWEMGRAAACEGRDGCLRRVNSPRGLFWKGAARVEKERRYLWDVFLQQMCGGFFLIKANSNIAISFASVKFALG